MELTEKQEIALKQLKKTFGNVAAAFKSLGLSRQTHYDWLTNSPEYKKQYNDIDFDLDEFEFVHSKLVSRIAEGSDTMIKFYLEKKGGKHGYSDKIQIEHSVDERSEEQIIKNIERLKSITGL